MVDVKNVRLYCGERYKVHKSNIISYVGVMFRVDIALNCRKYMRLHCLYHIFMSELLVFMSALVLICFAIREKSFFYDVQKHIVGVRVHTHHMSLDYRIVSIMVVIRI
jgi:hypothetical protein